MIQITDTLAFDPSWLYLIALVAWGIKSYFSHKTTDLVIIVGCAFFILVLPEGLISFGHSFGSILLFAIILKMAAILGENNENEKHNEEELSDAEILGKYGEVLEVLSTDGESGLDMAVPEEFLPCDKKKLERVLTRALNNPKIRDESSNENLKSAVSNGLIALARFIPMSEIMYMKQYKRKEYENEIQKEHMSKFVTLMENNMQHDLIRYMELVTSAQSKAS